MNSELDRCEVLAQCVEVVNNARVGLLTTADSDGMPHARWMGIGALVEGVRVLYTITRADARKVQEITDNPDVCWVFTEGEYRRVATLYGKGYPDYSPILRQKVWDQVTDRHLLYCLQAEGSELMVITTLIDRVELVRSDAMNTCPATAVVAGAEGCE